MEFRLLGPLEVVVDGSVVPLAGRRQRALLALLLLQANEVVSADRLVDRLWGETPPKEPLNALQFHVSRLRRVLPPSVLVTRAPGYLLRLTDAELDLARFERLTAAAGEAPPAEAARLLREALGLWRGPPLADAAGFLDPERARLEELRLAALEALAEAELAGGNAAAVVGELESLVAQHPFHERLRAQLILALYRSGRQADALAAYREARRLLADELGLEPGPELQRLERAILVQDPALEIPAVAAAERAILVAPSQPAALPVLLAIAEPLARPSTRTLVLAASAASRASLATAAAAVNDARSQLLARGVAARAAAFTSSTRGADLARLAAEQDVDLVLADADPAELSPEVVALLERAPCDVALLVGNAVACTGPVLTPFGGAEHDWAAVELAAWLAAGTGEKLRLAGAATQDADASRLVARAALLVQRVVGVDTEPLLVEPGAAGLIAAAADARAVVVGLSLRWRSEGIGRTRLEIADAAAAPVLLVRHGRRPGGLAPAEGRTRFTWSLSAAER